MRWKTRRGMFRRDGTRCRGWRRRSTTLSLRLGQDAFGSNLAAPVEGGGDAGEVLGDDEDDSVHVRDALGPVGAGGGVLLDGGLEHVDVGLARLDAEAHLALDAVAHGVGVLILAEVLGAVLGDESAELADEREGVVRALQHGRSGRGGSVRGAGWSARSGVATIFRSSACALAAARNAALTSMSTWTPRAPRRRAARHAATLLRSRGRTVRSSSRPVASALSFRAAARSHMIFPADFREILVRLCFLSPPPTRPTRTSSRAYNPQVA